MVSIYIDRQIVGKVRRIDGDETMANAVPEIVMKWGEPVAARGFAQIPNYLLFINQFLGEEHRLTPGELLVLVQLVAAWWKVDDLPFPSMATLSVRCGMSERQVLRAISKLEAMKLLKRVRRRTKTVIASNAYDLRPTVEMLAEIAKVYPNEFPRKGGLKLTSSEPDNGRPNEG